MHPLLRLFCRYIVTIRCCEVYCASGTSGQVNDLETAVTVPRNSWCGRKDRKGHLIKLMPKYRDKNSTNLSKFLIFLAISIVPTSLFAPRLEPLANPFSTCSETGGLLLSHCHLSKESYAFFWITSAYISPFFQFLRNYNHCVLQQWTCLPKVFSSYQRLYLCEDLGSKYV